MPILISTPQELSDIRLNLAGDYELINDIDLSSFSNWNPIGTQTTPFTGSLDGKGYKVTNLTSNRTTINIGLFGYAQDMRFFRNLGLENFNIFSTKTMVGALCGVVSGCIEESYNLYVKDSFIEAHSRNGALFGKTYKTRLRDSFSLNNTVRSRGYVGGLIGRAFWSDTSITNCFSASIVDDYQYGLFGGLLGGDDTVAKTYSSVYFDKEVATITVDKIALPKTTVEMKTQSTYEGWDFVNTWTIDEGVDYPTLQVFSAPEEVIPDPISESRTPSSFTSPIYSNVSTSVILPPTTENRNVISYVSAIGSNADAYRKVLRQVTSYVSSIDSNTVENLISSNKDVTYVDSYIKPIETSIKIIKHVNVNLESYINPIFANVEASFDIPIKPLFAYTFYQVNPSGTTVQINNTNSMHVENPSNVEVIE